MRKIVTKNVVLPVELAEFAAQQAAQQAEETFSHPNISKYIRRLVAEDYKRWMKKTGKKAA